MSSGLGAVVGQAPVLAAPAQDVLRLPDLTHGQLNGRPWEVGTVDELLDTLTADAEQLADFGGSDEVVHGGKHRYQTTGHLTRAPVIRETSRVTIEHLTWADAPRIAPEIHPFDNAAEPRKWLPEGRPTLVRKANGIKYVTSGDAVYRFYDAHRRLLYIGMTTMHPASRWNWHRKNAEWWELAAFVSVEWIFDKTTAAVEKAAIQNEQPLYNKQHVRSRSSFMTFTREGPAAVIEQFRQHLLPKDFAELVRAFCALEDHDT